MVALLLARGSAPREVAATKDGRQVGTPWTAWTVAALCGGWFYLTNLVSHGYLYPQDLEIHTKMFELPPGSRWE